VFVRPFFAGGAAGDDIAVAGVMADAPGLAEDVGLSPYWGAFEVVGAGASGLWLSCAS